MRQGFLAITSALAAAIVVSVLSVFVAGQAPTAGTGTAPRTAWGEPDLQGIWDTSTRTPLERPARFAGRPVMTEQEAAQAMKELAESQAADARERDQPRTKNDETDVAGAYNHAVYGSVITRFARSRSGQIRTSLIVDPSDGRIPPTTPEAQKRAAVVGEYREALLQGTSVGWPGPPSPRRTEVPPFYSEYQINRADGPEDRSLAERCLGQQGGTLPDFDGQRHIVQSPGAVSIFYELFQGQGGERVIRVTNAPHLPPHVRQWWGDARGHWEGNTLVIDTTNFSPKSYFRESRENLHLVERFTRLDATTLEYTVTIEDPTVWTKPWTVTQELTKQDAQANQVFYEPRCHEGNVGLIGQLAGARAAERAFAEGRGPNPATLNTTSTRNCYRDPHTNKEICQSKSLADPDSPIPLNQAGSCRSAIAMNTPCARPKQ